MIKQTARPGVKSWVLGST